MSEKWVCWLPDKCKFSAETMEKRNDHVKKKHPEDWKAVMKSLDERGIKYEH